MTHPATITGGCLCGAVRFQARSGDEAPTACHCEQCRRWSGHVWAAVDGYDLTLTGEESLRWYRASTFAARGFCVQCGSSLFWQADGLDHCDIAMGCIDAPTGMHLGNHIFTAFKGDYYDIADGLPQTA
ncbi:MAG: GFA family protein [Paracoccus sp. (in: a-proteobacteria)]